MTCYGSLNKDKGYVPGNNSGNRKVETHCKTPQRDHRQVRQPSWMPRGVTEKTKLGDSPPGVVKVGGCIKRTTKEEPWKEGGML